MAATVERVRVKRHHHTRYSCNYVVLQAGRQAGRRRDLLLGQDGCQSRVIESAGERNVMVHLKLPARCNNLHRVDAY